MTLRKITIDNSVTFVPKSEKPKKMRLNQKHQKLAHSLVNKTIKNGLLVDLASLNE